MQYSKMDIKMKRSVQEEKRFLKEMIKLTERAANKKDTLDIVFKKQLNRLESELKKLTKEKQNDLNQIKKNT